MKRRNVQGLDQDGYRILFGVNAVREAFRAGRKVAQIGVRDGSHNMLKNVEAKGKFDNLLYMDKHELSQVCGSTQHQGVVAKVEALPNTSLKGLVKDKGSDLLIVMVDGVQDPHNLGAIMRSADGAGVDLVVVSSKGSASIQLGSVAKASAGASEHQPLLVVGDLVKCMEEMKGHGFSCIALEADATETLQEVEMPFPLCLVVGGEDQGVKGRLRTACTGEAHIPLRGKVNSLNVSVAAAVASFEAARRRPAPAATPA